MLKISNFPVNGSSGTNLSKAETIKFEANLNQASSELQSIKAEMQNNSLKVAETAKPESMVFDENDAKDSKHEQGELNSIKILGELLVQLRKNRSMSLLMLARQISKIEFEGKTAVIYSDDKDIVELNKNEKYFAEVSSFFESKGLSFRVQEKIEDNSKLEELKRLLGRKLVIK